MSQQKAMTDSGWCVQHAALEAQLADSAQEAARLRAQVTALESELVYSATAQHSESPAAAASISSAAHAARAAEVASLQAEVVSKERQISSLTARLQAASSAQSQVSVVCDTCCTRCMLYTVHCCS